MRRAIAIGFIAIGLALVIGLLLAPNTRVVRFPPPTPGVHDPTASPVVTDIGDYDCGPDCYKEELTPHE